MARIKNRGRLKAKLLNLPEEIKKGLRATLEKHAQGLVDLQKTLVPVASGDLQDSINWVYGDAPKGSLALGGGGGKKAPTSSGINDLKVTVFAGGGKVYYARFVEFGTQPGRKGARAYSKSKQSSRRVLRTHPGNKAQPFFYPAYRMQRKRIARALKAAVSKAIKKTAKMGGGP